MISREHRSFSMRQPAEFVRWVLHVNGWVPELIAGTPIGWSVDGLYVRVDGRTVELKRDEWSYCDSSG